MVGISMITLQAIHKHRRCDVNTSSCGGVLLTTTDGVTCRTGGLADLVSGRRSRGMVGSRGMDGSRGMVGRRSALRRRQSGL